MANAAALRLAITASARDAAAAHPEDLDERMAAFACKLYGQMFALGEFAVEDVLWAELLTQHGTALQAAPACAAAAPAAGA